LTTLTDAAASRIAPDSVSLFIATKALGKKMG
jgi:hypothetical protein